MKEKMAVINGDGSLIETEDILQSKHNNVSNIPTPKAFVKDKGGFDYVDEAYMRNQLNTHYPIWKWEIIKYEFVGDKAIVVHGRLTIIDHGVERHFDSVAAHRIASNQKGYVDIGNDLKAANSDCFKVAVNRLCNVADDVYRKQIPDLELSEEQKETILDLLDGLNSATVGNVKAGIKGLDINSMNYEATVRKLEQMKG
jgi:hypothetical protein|tara:strand:- start:2036 stop:2632 length:597 start_codon:yes stop_codon:yes gene_type:complete